MGRLDLNAANVVTLSRMIISALLLIPPAFSTAFFTLYFLGGLTDIVDGPIARRIGAESEFGGRLDGSADLIFVFVCLVKLLPAIEFPIWVWYWTILILVMKVIAGLYGMKNFGKPLFLHTPANKITGLCLFLLPLIIGYCLTPPILLACIIATIASVQEILILKCGNPKNYLV